MTVTVSSFLGAFPQFADHESASVAFWLNIAVNLVDPAKFGNMTDPAVSLATAHYLALAQRASKSRDGSSSPGVLASKAAGGLAASYDVAAATIEGEGQWNLTVYGTQFVDLRDMFGAGGMQVGVYPWGSIPGSPFP